MKSGLNRHEHIRTAYTNWLELPKLEVYDADEYEEDSLGIAQGLMKTLFLAVVLITVVVRCVVVGCVVRIVVVGCRVVVRRVVVGFRVVVGGSVVVVGGNVVVGRFVVVGRLVVVFRLGTGLGLGLGLGLVSGHRRAVVVLSVVVGCLVVVVQKSL